MRVRCKSPNASTLISGVNFTPDANGHMLSEEIDEATAARFCSIKGYELAEDDGAKKAEEARLAAAAEAERKAQEEAEAAAAEAAAKAKAEKSSGNSDSAQAEPGKKPRAHAANQ